MNDDSLKIKKFKMTAIDNTITDRIIASKNPVCALLYLYLIRADDEKQPSDICRELDIDRDSFNTALLELRKTGAFENGQQAYNSKESAPPSIINQARRQDPDFCALCSFFEKSAGRIIKRTEISALYDAYGRLRLPPPVIMTLITHLCGTSRGISCSKFSKEACLWSDIGIKTIEQAEEHLQKSRELNENVRAVAKTLKISGRALSPSETEYIRKWLDWGFPVETLEYAYDKTIIITGTLKWNYMDKILSNWHRQELHELEQVKNEKPSNTNKNFQKDNFNDNKPDEQYIKQVREYLENKKKSCD